MRPRLRRTLASGLALALVVLSVAPVASASGSAGVVVSTVAGDPTGAGAATALSLHPHDVVEHDGTLLIAADDVIRRLDLATGQLSTFAGVGGGAEFSEDRGDGGPAREAVLTGVSGLAVAPDGSVYVAESVGNRIRRVLPDGIIQTVAGSRSQSFTGDGGPARDATFYWPAAVAVAPDGSVFVSDHYNNRVRRISPDGVISTIAGTGEEAFSGDGGPAREAALKQPAGLAIEPDGSLLVADSGNHRIRRIRDGVITTVAGTGSTALGEDPSGDGSLLIGDGGPALDASLHKPMGVEVDGDGYLVADTQHHKIRRIDRDGVITTIAGGGKRGYGVDGVPATETNLLMPEAALRMRDGRVVIADTTAKRVRVIDPDGTISGVAGNYYYSFSGNGGPAAQAQVSSPVDVTVAPTGDVYLLENVDGWVIRRISASSGRIDAVMGLAADRNPPADGSPSLSSYLASAQALAAEHEGLLYVTDGHVIRQVDLEAGTQRIYAGTRDVGVDAGDGMDRLQATFVHPTALLASPDGSLYVGDVGANRVRRIAPDGVVHPVAGTGTAGFSGDGGPARQAELDWPGSLGMDAAGTLYIADSNNSRVRAVGVDGTIRTVVGAGPGLPPTSLPAPAASAVIQPRHITVLPDRSLVFTEGFWDLLRYDPVTGQVDRLGGTGDAGWRDGPAATSRFAFPNGLAWHDQTGQVLVADTSNYRIRAVSGALTDPAGDPEPAPAPAPEPTAPGPAPESGPVAAAPAARTIDGGRPSDRVPNNRFGDVVTGSTHERAISCLVWWQVANGRTASSYAPSAGVTRDAMAAFVARTILQAKPGALPDAPADAFTDDSTSVHQKSINQLAAVGIVGGTGDGSYSPGAVVSRGQMAKFLANAAKHVLGAPLPTDRDLFSDDNNSPFAADINRVAHAGLTGGRPDGTYGPLGPVLRDQMGSFLARTLDLFVANGARLPA